MATAFETLLQALGAALEMDLAPAADGIAEVAIGPRAVCLKPVAQETILRLFTTVQTPFTQASEQLPSEVLARALRRNLFAEQTAGHVIGLFNQTLIVSVDLPLEALSAEELAERLLLIARVAEEAEVDLFGGEGSAPAASEPTAEPAPEMMAFLRA
ncbi:MAG: type III secretion system chaperone [Candidatus Spyradenecus sp.]